MAVEAAEVLVDDFTEADTVVADGVHHHLLGIETLGVGAAADQAHRHAGGRRQRGEADEHMSPLTRATDHGVSVTRIGKLPLP